MKTKKEAYAIGTYHCRHQTPWERFKHKAMIFIKRVLLVTIIVFSASGIGYVCFAVGTTNSVNIIAAAQQDEAIPVLERIGSCEEFGQIGHIPVQIDPRTGQVWLIANKNGSVDVGAYAINSVWFPIASKMGLDLTQKSDNKTMALWIYHNKGTGDWSASANCWNK